MPHMTAEKLLKMQQDSLKRYGLLPEPEGSNIAKTIVLISEHIESIKNRGAAKRKQRPLLPDLMAPKNDYPTIPEDMNNKIGIEINPSAFHSKTVELYKGSQMEACQPAEGKHKIKVVSELPPVQEPNRPRKKPTKDNVDYEKIRQFVQKVSPRKKSKNSIFESAPASNNVDFRKINNYAGRAIFNPGDRSPQPIKRPPARYDNEK